ncbi:MAG: putative copper-exporting P-type ATPase A [Methanosaeta sp. PtaB.Bin018]|jgi:copper chaperone CopZ|nr:heavy-metal-associated domain-containing protein [Methanothrix sp.]OPX75880.1 MAG: putative copper-exporting P-type ATPase A [Methanosaeta sp. PtaB.Bin018]OPY43164.1 MAG: putative copper-exporting P-type ATPase A [Methanosaeta sp. PtaU1.Bin016]
MVENKKAELFVVGMACAGCSGAVKDALLKLEGVHEARVDLAEKKAYVEYDPGKVTLQDLRKAVEGAGYKVA